MNKNQNPVEIKLIQALLELLKENNFDDLSVQQICQVSKISRTSFYNYYINKEEFKNIIIENALNYLTAILHNNNNLSLKKGVLVKLFEFVKSERDLWNMLFEHFAIIDHLPKYIEEIIINSEINLESKLLEVSHLIPSPYALDLYFSSILSIITTWFKNGLKENLDELADIILTITTLQIRGD